MTIQHPKPKPPDTHDEAIVHGSATQPEDYPRLVYLAPYFDQAPLAELFEPAVIEAAKTVLPPLVQPAADQAAAEAVAELAVMRVGDTMTGPLFLSPLIPTQDSQATTKHYVDSVWAADLSHALLDDLARDLPIYGSWGSVDNMQADATPVFNAYLAAGDVIIPPGNYRFDTQPNAITAARTIRGSSPSGTSLFVNYPAGDFLRIGTSAGFGPANAQIERLRIIANVDRTSGAAIHAFPCHVCSVRDIVIAPGNGTAWRHYNGIQIDGDNGTSQFGFGIRGFDIGWCHGFGIGLRSYPMDVSINQGIIANCGGPGIDIESVSGCYITQTDIIYCLHSVRATPPDVNHNINALFVVNCFGDSAVSHCWEFGGTDGQISDIHLTNVWGSGSSGGCGFHFNNPRINGLTMANCHAHGSYGYGIQIVAGKNISINGGQIGENSAGGQNVATEIEIAAGVSDVVIANNIIGAVGYFGVNQVPLKAAAGISVEPGAGDHIIITGNKIDLGYYYAPGICKATGSNIVIRHNTGWRTTFAGYQRIAAGTQSVTFPHFLIIDDPTRIQFAITPAVDFVQCGINRFWATEPTTGVNGTATVHADAVATADFWFSFRLAAFE